MSSSSNRAQIPHTVMNYLLTRAVTDGTNESAVIRVPYADLLSTIGKKVETDEDRQNELLDLVVHITLSWEEHDDDEEQAVEMDVDFKKEYED